MILTPLAALAAALLLAQPSQLPPETAAATPDQPKAPTVHLLRIPDGGIQPQALTEPDGTLHLLYYKGDPKAGDLFYTKRPAHAADFAEPIRVNSQPGSAIAIGNDRGGQIALGRGGRVHVAWNGSSEAQPKGPKNPAMPADSLHNGLPMLYARLTDAGDAFEPQRNLMTASTALDGGGSVAADPSGNVYIVWHALPLGLDHTGSEQDRRVFIARSSDDGHTFAPEAAISPPELGACGCCGLKVQALAGGNLAVMYRGAASPDQRAATLLQSTDHGATFKLGSADPWPAKACPMSTFALAPLPQSRFAAAWETEGNIRFRLFDQAPEIPAAAAIHARSIPAKTAARKYPAIAAGPHQILIAWAEGTGWGQGGTVHWQILSETGEPIPSATGSVPSLPAWSLIAAITNPDESFTILY